MANTRRTTKPVDNNGDMSEQEARKVLMEKEKTRAEACLKEIQNILDKYGYMFRVIPQFTQDGRVTGAVTLARKPEGGKDVSI